MPQFFRHEKGKKIGVSTLAIVVAPFLGTMYVSHTSGEATADLT
jgi:hypothetical protein